MAFSTTFWPDGIRPKLTDCSTFQPSQSGNPSVDCRGTHPQGGPGRFSTPCYYYYIRRPVEILKRRARQWVRQPFGAHRTYEAFQARQGRLSFVPPLAVAPLSFALLEL